MSHLQVKHHIGFFFFYSRLSNLLISTITLRQHNYQHCAI